MRGHSRSGVWFAFVLDGMPACPIMSSVCKFDWNYRSIAEHRNFRAKDGLERSQSTFITKSAWFYRITYGVKYGVISFNGDFEPGKKRRQLSTIQNQRSKIEGLLEYGSDSWQE
jgi:hypothetical protein